MTQERVGGEYHESEHRARHSTLYAPLFQFAFGDVATWGTKKACVLFAGEGREAAILAPFVQEMWVADDTESCLEVMRSRFVAEHRVHVLPVDSGVGVLESGSIDILTGLVALMHMGSTSIRNGHAQQIQRLLSPSGRALVQVMHGEGYQDSPDHPYGAYDVGFKDDHEVVAYWSQYLPVQWVLRTPPIPSGRAEACWWWVCLGQNTPLNFFSFEPFPPKEKDSSPLPSQLLLPPPPPVDSGLEEVLQKEPEVTRVRKSPKVDPSRLEIVVVGHTRHAELQTTLDRWVGTLPGYRAIYVIANHPETLTRVVLPERTTSVQTGRIPRHVGCLSESWNLGLQWTFHQHPDIDWVILSQDDVKVDLGWLELVNAHDADFYNAPAGDMIMLVSRKAYREVGWFDEHLRTIGGQDLDWISRAVLLLGEDRIVSEDGHGWRYNPIGLEKFWESSKGRAKPGASYQCCDGQLKDHLQAKWGITSEELRAALIAHAIPKPVQKEFDWYPWIVRT